MTQANDATPTRTSSPECLHGTAPIDVDAIATHFGIEVEECQFPGDSDVAALFHVRNDRPVVTLNRQKISHAELRRATLAHVLGHYALHGKRAKNRFVEPLGHEGYAPFWDPTEAEANRFAEQLLMPEPLVVAERHTVVERYRERHGVSTMPASELRQAMARRFAVSAEAMERRLKHLHLLH